MWSGTMKGIISVDFWSLLYKETWTRKAKGSFVDKMSTAEMFGEAEKC